MNIDLKGKRAIVCGSSQGIGEAIAIEFAKSGANVTLVARSEENLTNVLKRLAPGDHNYLRLDFAEVVLVRKLLQEFLETTKRVDILINNTGGPTPGLAIDADIQDFAKAFSMHLMAHQVFVQACVPLMKANGYGRIINIISTSVKQPIAGLGVSNTIRGAVANWSKTLSQELGSTGITVNNILPGFIETQRLFSLIASRAKLQNKSEEEIAEEMRLLVPVKRFAKPEEVAAVATFLASPHASYINGVNLPVDGGRTLSL